MTRFYLAPYVGAGSDTEPFQPDVPDAPFAFSTIDLRGDATRLDGFCLLRVTDSLSGVGFDLGDSLDDPLPRSVSRRIENQLGLTLDSRQRLREIIVELLLRHATPDSDKTRWDRLTADHRGRMRIYLGEQIYDAPAILNTVVTDNFNRADEELEASANWSVSDADSSYSIVSNQLDITGGGTAERRTAHWSADSFGPNCYAQGDYVTKGTIDNGLMLRHDGTHPVSGNLYMGRDNGFDYDIAKIISGSFTRLTAGGSAATGEYYFEADGSTLTLKVDSVQKLQTTDTDLTGADFAGFVTVTGDGGIWDNFEAGDLGAIYPPFPRRQNTLVRM